MAAPKVCEIHRYHRPKALTTEAHHVVPQSWQAFWRPDGAPVDVLWFPETVRLCPTGHRNVHFYLVQMMVAQKGAGSEDPTVGWSALAKSNRESRIALRAMTHWKAAGGSLMALAGAGQYGRGLPGSVPTGKETT